MVFIDSILFQCIEQSWYMSLEMQIFLFSPFLMVPVWYIIKHVGEWWGLAFSSLFTIGITIFVCVRAYLRELDPTILV